MQGKRKMEFQKFIKVYDSLNEHHRKIAFQILYLMDRKCKRPSKNENVKQTVYDKVKEKQKELHIGYAELYRKVAELEEAKEKEEIFSDKTYESVMRRNTIDSPVFEDICQILKLPQEEIKGIMLSVQCSDQVNIEWLFKSLSHKNQNAICALVNLLLIEETSPEYFDP